ncbi:SPX domain-containing protein [Venturia nashicola]|uniref:SPX domain-containing protein n=1 Tax=Venturia nashicola TaxID=86259 RepID=A0A4Z1NE17_9PEZI|nr:SPX domain-containing protein [Venturia nashicola]
MPALDNIDYDEIKHLIKENTTPGRGKAVSIPGQGSDVELTFERKLYALLVEEHDRIGLFVKSKSLEIQRRLEHLDRKLRQLELRAKSDDGSRAPRPERYGKVEQEAIKAGEEIRSLSRFIGAQRLAFAKLLKKFKKWAGSDALEIRFKSEVLDRPSSFTTVILDDSLEHWTEILQVIRAVHRPHVQSRGLLQSIKHQSPTSLSQPDARPRPMSSLIVSQLERATGSASDVNFDVAFAEAPIGESGTRAVYWVHQDQLIELQVVLLQQMRLYIPNVNQVTLASGPSSLSQSPALTRTNSLSRQPEGQIEKEVDTGMIILDNVQDYAHRQSTGTVSDTEDATGQSFLRPAATARWAASDEAIVSMNQPRASGKGGPAKVRKKHLAALLNVDRDFTPWKSSGKSTPVDGSFYTNTDADSMTVEEARSVLAQHTEIQPLAAIFSKRTRFVGLSNTLSAGQWCSLDSQISISKVVRDDLVGKEWASKLSSGATSFPYAVLEVRSEGLLSKCIIETLDKSHLTERVRGFSLSSHAVWQCWKPKSMSPPFWLPVLNRDIRKVPEAVPVHRRKSSQIQATLNKTSTESEYDHTGSSTAVTTGESSVTSGPPSPAENGGLGDCGLTGPPRKKKKVSKLKIPETRYWNEYDHPEDGSDDENGYYIYMDPNATNKWPGQETVENMFAMVKSLFITPKPDDEESRGLLNEHFSSDVSTSPTSSDDDMKVQIMPSAKRRQRQHNHGTSGAYGTFNDVTIPSLDIVYVHPSPRLIIMTLSFTASTIITFIIGILAATGKKKLMGEVDVGIVLGVVGSLLFALVGMVSVVTVQERISFFKWAIIGLVFSAICIADGVMVGDLVRQGTYAV